MAEGKEVERTSRMGWSVAVRPLEPCGLGQKTGILFYMPRKFFEGLEAGEGCYLNLVSVFKRLYGCLWRVY